MKNIKVPIESLIPGPIRQELTEEQTKRLKLVYDICGDLTAATLEEFELGFMRDVNPDSEIRIWERIAVAFHKAITRYPDLTNARAKLFVSSFILMSTNGPDAPIPIIDGSDWLRECWRNPVK